MECGGRRLGVLARSVLVANLLVIAGCDRSAPRNFGVVKEGVLYRSGQLTPDTFEGVLEDRQIRAVISLRPDRGQAPNSDAQEAEICRQRGVKFFRIPPQVAGAGAPGDTALDHVARAFLTVMDDPANHPVLVHCTAGRDRTGAMCAVFRMEYDRWRPDDALAEMRDFGFDPEKDAAARAYADYVRSYRPRRKPD